MKQMRLAAILAVILVGTAAWAESQPPYVRATGEASVSARPDRATLQIGVVTQAASAQNAATQNAAKTASLIAALRRSLGADADIHTSGYSLNPNFRSPKDGGQLILNGYTATNAVEITTNDLANVGKVIDAGTQAGANDVRGLEFGIKDEAPLRAQALREAAQKARASAEAMAAGLGLKVIRVLSAEEGSAQVIRPMRAMMAAAANNTPIEAGNVKVDATVTLTLEVGP